MGLPSLKIHISHRGIRSTSYQSQSFSQMTPGSTSFDSGRQRFGEPPGETVYVPRQPGTPAQIMPGPSPGLSPSVPSYSTLTGARPGHAAGSSYQIPRSELPNNRLPQQPEYHLPPIRQQPQAAAPPNTTWQRNDRAGRVDIGGLIDKTDPLHRR